MSFLDVLISKRSEDTEVKMCHAYFFSYPLSLSQAYGQFWQLIL